MSYVLGTYAKRSFYCRLGFQFTLFLNLKKRCQPVSSEATAAKQVAIKSKFDKVVAGKKAVRMSTKQLVNMAAITDADQEASAAGMMGNQMAPTPVAGALNFTPYET